MSWTYQTSVSALWAVISKPQPRAHLGVDEEIVVLDEVGVVA
jgi:hypothetical protein